jgi:hypothetical protein
MAKRFRYYFRQGWHVVNVDRANVWNWEKDNQEFGNDAHFKALNLWCEQSFPKDAWVSRYRNWQGEKEFVFKEEKHANWFKLKWL